MWPQLLDLNVGETREAATPGGTRLVKLLDVEEQYEPDYWCEHNPARRTLAAARLRVEVDGARGEVLLRPYQPPVAIHGLRLYGEYTRAWATECAYAGMKGVRHDAGLSALAADEAWGPPDLVFPLRAYRWRGNAYNNTWLSLVPYNLLYYHRGEDWGAIPNRMDVRAGLDGTVAASPLPSGDGRSNSVILAAEGGLELHYGHMNLETIEPRLTLGARVERGQTLGQTGESWAGRKAQSHDPHLHLSIHRNGRELGTYPYLADAYFRMYPDVLLAVAGGYAFTLPGRAVDLDATRSLARPGRRITSYAWVLHDGARAEGARARVHYEKPGLYAEELIVRADDGSEERDFLQVRVYAPKRGRNCAYGWAYQWPLRGVRPGTAVLYWNRLVGTQGPVTIDFGAGSPTRVIEKEAEYHFDTPGIFTVRLDSRGPGGEPVTVKLRTVVEDSDC